MNNIPHEENSYQQLIRQIGSELDVWQRQAAGAVNSAMVNAYWHIGRHIVEFEQGGNAKAEYGSFLFNRLAKDLSEAYGKSFGKSNLIYIRKFYLLFPKGGTVSHLLSWSHYYELLKIEDPLERSFFEKQTGIERWTVRELKRQKTTLLFHRLAVSKDKEGILQLAREGQLLDRPEDLLRDPFVLEFLTLPEPAYWHEDELEERLITHLQQFLLELGKGFAFVGRQYRVQIGDRFFRVDLVFYHRILKCFVLIDLKKNEVEHGDIGQMNFYLNYFREEENADDDNEPIGIVLARERNELVVRYATANVNANLLVGKYQLYLPDREELARQLRLIMEA